MAGIASLHCTFNGIRNKIPRKSIWTRCGRSWQASAMTSGAEPIEFNGEHGHVHLLVNYPLKVAMSHLVASLEGVSSRLLRRQFGDFYPWFQRHGVLWSPSYFAAACAAPRLIACGNALSSNSPALNPKFPAYPRLNSRACAGALVKSLSHSCGRIRRPCGEGQHLAAQAATTGAGGREIYRHQIPSGLHLQPEHPVCLGLERHQGGHSFQPSLPLLPEFWQHGGSIDEERT